METGVKRTQRDYTLTSRRAVVDQVEKGELTHKEAQDRYGIQGQSTVWSAYASMVSKTEVQRLMQPLVVSDFK
jgi:hypothetical protein